MIRKPDNVDSRDTSDVQEVVASAEKQLRQLLQQKDGLTRRIQKTKRAIYGLVGLFGVNILNEELRVLLGEKRNTRKPGLTEACRSILMEAGRPMTRVEVRDSLHQTYPELVEHLKNPMSSVSTILHRLANYGEARIVDKNGSKAWELST